jgi:hypothetical protein
MTGSVLTEEGREVINRLSKILYDGRIPGEDVSDMEGKEVESRAVEYIENKGFEYVLPEEIDSIDSLQGSSRKVFVVPDRVLATRGDFVVKFTRHNAAGRFKEWAGRKQNEYEVRVWNNLDSEQKEFFVPVRDWGDDFFWIIMDYAEVFSRTNGNIDFEDEKPKIIYSTDESDAVYNEMKDSGVFISDSNYAFGMHEGRLKCLDYGTKVKKFEGYDLNPEEFVDSNSIRDKYLDN